MKAKTPIDIGAGISPKLNLGDGPAEARHAQAACGDSDQPYCPELDPDDPAIAEFLHSAYEQPPADDDLKLNEVGRDYHDMPAEVGLLSAILADPKEVLDKAAKGLSSETFYDRKNRDILLVVLYFDVS